MTTYFVPQANMGKIERKLNAMQKRAGKLGVDFSFTIGTPEVRKVTVYLPNGQVDLLNSPAFVNCYPVTCTDTEVVISGHRVLGKMEKVDGADVVYGNVPAQYRGMENYYCEHCNTNRPAKHLFIVEEVATGNTMSVGSGCLADYTDHTNALDYVSFFQDIQLVDRMMEENMQWSGGRGDYVLLEKYYYCVMMAFQKDGYIKTEYADNTRDTAFDLYEQVQFDGAKLAEAKTALDKLVGYLSEKKPLNSFEWNIFDYLSNVYNSEEDYSALNIRMAGIISASVLLLDKADSFEVSGNFVFNKGDKIETELTFVSKSFMCHSDYGDMWIYKFVDSSENIFIWKTTNKDKTEHVGGGQYVVTKKFEEGTTYTIKATVKEHSTYGTENQNVLTRVRIA